MATKAIKRLRRLYERVVGIAEFADHVSYDELAREEQNALVRLFGGGTVRNVDEGVLDLLGQRGLISGEKLTVLGEEVCREALPAIVERLGERAIRSGRAS